ncbi:MAG: tetratricopeptide repeat protein [Pseudomonadota bacterium]
MEASAGVERLIHLDAMMAGFYLANPSLLETFAANDLEDAARLKVDALQFSDLDFRPDEDALLQARSVLERARAAGDRVSEAHLIAKLGEAAMVQGRGGDLAEYVGLLRRLNKDLNYPRFERDALQLEAHMLKMQGDTVGVLAKREEQLELYAEHDQPVLAALTLNGVANALYDLGDYQAAFDQYVFALEQIEGSGEGNSSNYAVLLKNAGSALTDLGQHAEAIPYYEKALANDQRLGNERGQAYTKFWMAKSLNALGERERAADMARAAADLSARYSNKMQTADILVWLADRALEDENPSEADAALRRAAAVLDLRPEEDLAESLGDADRFWAVSYARSMAAVLSDMGEPVEALRYAEYALAMHTDWLEAEKVQAAVDAAKLQEIRTKDQAIQLLESESRLQLAEIALRDGALERQRLLTTMGYAGVGGLAVIALLAAFGWRNSRRLATVRETLVSEEHHRTKNALQIAASLVRAGQSKGVDQRLFAMGLVYEHLHHVENESVVEAEPFLTTLIERLSEALAPDGVEVELDCEVDTLKADLATPIGLIVCEALINSFKHAFPGGGGFVRVALIERGRELSLSVRDDGVGDANKTPPDSGKGQQLIHDLAAQLKASAQLRQDSQGTSWTIESISQRRRI